MGASRHPSPSTIVLHSLCSFAFNTGTPFGVLLIQGVFVNDYPNPTKTKPRASHPRVRHAQWSRAELCAQYTPERVAEIAWIAPEQVEEAARLIWHSRPVSYYAWSGHEHHANTTETVRAMALL